MTNSKNTDLGKFTQADRYDARKHMEDNLEEFRNYTFKEATHILQNHLQVDISHNNVRTLYKEIRERTDPTFCSKVRRKRKANSKQVGRPGVPSKLLRCMATAVSSIIRDLAQDGFLEEEKYKPCIEMLAQVRSGKFPTNSDIQDSVRNLHHRTSTIFNTTHPEEANPNPEKSNGSHK